MNVLSGQQIAETTLEQLGGAGKLKAMIAAHNFSYDSQGVLKLAFKLCKKANIVKIELNEDDLYNVYFYKYSKKTFECPEVARMSGIYAEDLLETLESYTGLAFRL